ncbi:DUF881 domain-containing protein [Tepidibacter thalassicus]|uniref:Uncharacterized conserved protein YlxW, UPF0749 family n=1 Tax=Tepidibacter thalassicus DSM 15285 TaxID=1123350 RepID=A0A1M5QDR3_9FIRM|nr:DUF881 domain-containing protein [Tepidibacter thalassicus]SHH12295.1 Uncharacterized conserved protein YlxW, UPF0749 family [Tepidibacter thalassicus DSM 15285]
MKKNSLSLLILSFFLGMLLIIEFKTVDKTTGGLVSSQKANQLAIELKSLRDRKEALAKELKCLEDRIDEYKDSEAKKSVIVKNLKNDMKKYEILAGYTDVKGPGVLIKLEEAKGSQDRNILLYNYDNLLRIINKLKAAGAEAISINNERIVSNTEIFLLGEKLMVNGDPIFPPFEIKCIGNPDTLEATLNLRFGVIWQLRTDWDLDITIQKKENIEIPRYSKKVKFKYAKPVDNKM